MGQNGRSRGLATVEFQEEEQAAKAMEELSGRKLQKREMYIKYAKPSRDRTQEPRHEQRDYRENREPREHREPREPREHREPRVEP